MDADDPDMATASPAMDPVLLARMTGRLGDARTIERKAAELAGAMCEPLERLLAETAGMKVTIERDSVALGMRRAFEEAEGTQVVRSSASIHGWCSGFSIATSTTLAVAFVESLLGGSQNDASDRALTPVERDVSSLLFERILSVFREAAGATEGKGATDAPRLAADAEDEEDERPDVHSVRIALKVSFDARSEPIAIVLPQTAVMKVEVVLANHQQDDAPDAPPEWVERLSRQVSRSDVRLRAHVRLEPLTLDVISRLEAGDILTFADAGDINVHLQANGRDLASCELGRSGSRYMLRLKAPERLEDELLRDLMP